MIVVIILRWIFGYIKFSAEGKFPERFVNLTARKGINIWKLRGEKNSVSGFAAIRDIKELSEAAEKTENRIHIIREYGLPYLFKKYRHRSGLLAGTLICAVLCHILSGHIWIIKINTPDMINEYEIRAVLREYGLYEGAKADSINVSEIINSISSSDRRISWMTINVMGTEAEINISPNLSEKIKKQETPKLSNMVSSADGTVTRVNVYKGTAKVQAGDGIRKNQLLVSGIVEYNNGKTVLFDSSAKVFAKTARTVSISIPSKINILSESECSDKTDVSVFGLTLPVTLNGDKEGLFTKKSSSKQLTILKNPIPVFINTEKWQEYKKQPVELTLSQAEELLKNKLCLYEFFMLSSAKDGTVLSRNIKVRKEKELYILTADYEIEEDVCKKNVIEFCAE